MTNNRGAEVFVKLVLKGRPRSQFPPVILTKILHSFLSSRGEGFFAERISMRKKSNKAHH